jgi:hypothetical protein
MSIGSISLKFTLNHFPIKKSFDTRINVKTELEYLRFSSSYLSDGLGLSYINSPVVNPENNILIIDKSNFISSNAKEAITENEYLSDNFLIDYAGFHVADVVKTINGIDTPFYYWHDLSNIDGISNVQILDSNKNPVNSDLWLFADEFSKLGFARKGVYSNLICSLKQNAYEIFYIKYKDLSSNTVTEELLNSKPYYEQVSFLSERTKRAYTITQIQSKYLINIVFDSFNYSPTANEDSQRFWLKRKSTSKITLEKPGRVSLSDRWNLKVTPGDFFHNGAKYWVPDYYLQNFTPAFPYRLAKERKAIVLNKNLFYVDLNPIVSLDLDGYYVYIILKENSGTIKRVFTNDPSADTFITKQGFITDIFYEKEAIKSISTNSGFILLNEDIEENQEVYVTYRYVEQYYVYDFLNLNPSVNPELLGKKIVFYLLPDASERAIHHLVLDSDNNIIDSSIPEYISLGDYDQWALIAQDSKYFEIGDVHVLQTLSISDILMLDTRVLGGGIAESKVEASLKLQNEASWYWDMGDWDGSPYPGMGALVVYLPRSILKEMNGNFDRDQVEEIVKRHTASGSYVIVKYYDESTEITKITPGDKEVKVDWKLINANQYKIYIGSSPDNLSLYSIEPGTRTSVTINNLENDKNYYIQVASVVGGIERLGSRILGFMPFSYAGTFSNIKYGEGKFITGSYE